jgi:hypothetical protein
MAWPVISSVVPTTAASATATCPTSVDSPDIVEVFTVPATIDACRLEVHPVTAG